ncbi:MAG: DNA polymerase III subunit epsilon [Gammaproteobacteria bacterium]|nr:DNA polymerase III subunit epsilon [Gammaproteobacteria bacterium]
MRQIVLDTETTGLETELGHRVIEIGCVELINRRRTGKVFHKYIRPEREVDREAMQVHGITTEFLASQPLFNEVVDEFLSFVADAELVIHNADFDVGFLDYELALLGSAHGCMTDHCRIVDTLNLARRLHPGQRNSLDALCRRYEVDSSARDLHGALLDARLLADVYLAMTGGQAMLLLSDEDSRDSGKAATAPRRIDREGLQLPVFYCSAAEQAAHERRLQQLDAASDGRCLWLELETVEA